jgi:hypothetical protein
LSISAELFEAILSNYLRSSDFRITAKQQDSIIRKDSSRRWKRLPSEIPYSVEIMKFIDNLGEFCKNQTFKPNAPYAPGVNGFAVRGPKAELFESEPDWSKNIIYYNLQNVISTCVAFNLFEVHKVIQGKKGQVNIVYYLNRWLCVRYGLPLSYGNWRHRNIEEINKWLK